MKPHNTHQSHARVHAKPLSIWRCKGYKKDFNHYYIAMNHPAIGNKNRSSYFIINLSYIFFAPPLLAALREPGCNLLIARRLYGGIRHELDLFRYGKMQHEGTWGIFFRISLHIQPGKKLKI
jgi:hypothetical protein